MKYKLLSLVALLFSAHAVAENYRIVQSPSQKLDVWIDDVKNNQVSSWCQSNVELRIVTHGEKNVEKLNSFLPRVAGLMASQCKPLQQLDWTFNDNDGSELAKGNASKEQQWKPVVTPQQPQQPENVSVAEPVQPELNSPQADTTPWVQFSLPEGCHFRSWWLSAEKSRALFIPSTGNLDCQKNDWLSGHSQVTQLVDGKENTMSVTFLKGFPVVGLNDQKDISDLEITTVNNERMVLSDVKSPDSWLILPFDPQFGGWRATNQIVVQMPASSDISAVNARVQEIHKVWSSWLRKGTLLQVQLVEQLHPELKYPAAAVYHTVND